MTLDDGSVVAAKVRYFRAAGDYAWTDAPGLGNHFLSGTASKPGHLVKPPGFAYVDGSEPPGLPACGPCVLGVPLDPLCSVCWPYELDWLGTWGDGVSIYSPTSLMRFSSAEGGQYLPIGAPVYIDGKQLVRIVQGAGDTGRCVFRRPDGSEFYIETNYRFTCPTLLWGKTVGFDSLFPGATFVGMYFIPH